MDKTESLKKLIENRTTEAGKEYEFSNNRNVNLPVEHWFQHPPEGLTLFIVFYTQACRWSKCMGCNLPSKVSSEHVPFKHIIKQADYVFEYVLNGHDKKNLRKIIISNNGSILDEDTFSTTALMYFIARMNMECPDIRKLSLETRPEYVDYAELEVLSRALKEGDTPTELEIAIGFEAYNDRIRNEYFGKGLALNDFEELAEKLGEYNFYLKTYFMQKPVPGMTEEEGIEDIKKAICYIDGICEKYGLDINIHLNPTYVARGTKLETEFRKGNYSPPLLESVRQAVLEGENKKPSVFIGLFDEGLAVEGGSFIRPDDKPLIQKLQEFNQTQNYQLLK